MGHTFKRNLEEYFNDNNNGNFCQMCNMYVGLDVYSPAQWDLKCFAKGKQNKECLLAYSEIDGEMEQHKY